MNQSQIQDHITMINHINLYIHNTSLNTIAHNVFASDITDFLINQIEELKTNFMKVWLSLDKKYQENFIKCAYENYGKY